MKEHFNTKAREYVKAMLTHQEARNAVMDALEPLRVSDEDKRLMMQALDQGIIVQLPE